MRRMRVVPLMLLVAACAASMGAATAATESPVSTQQQSLLIRILADTELWAPAFGPALERITSWERVGETRVAVFPNRFQGQRPFATNDSVVADASRLNEAAQSTPPRPRPAAAPLFRRLTLTAFTLQAAVTRFPEDLKFHLVWGANQNFLRPGMSIARIQQKYGRPQRVERLVVQTDSDRRPAVLTLYRYADGALTFAETDLAPAPGIVDRVILDVKMVHAALFQE